MRERKPKETALLCAQEQSRDRGSPVRPFASICSVALYPLTSSLLLSELSSFSNFAAAPSIASK